MQLALGPLAYYWSREETLAYYQELVTSDVDIVYLGETICSKRRQLSLADWITIGQQWVDSGKEVLLSSLCLIEAESELGLVKSICEQDDFLVEANDFSAVHFLAERGLPFVTGPSVNIYNGRTLDYLIGLNLQRWVLPIELGKFDLQQIVDDAQGDVEVEVFAYGYLPLAYSARCFTARAENLPKDDCGFVCSKYPEGLKLYSQEDRMLFNINGIQTQSGLKVNLVNELETMRQLGVSVARLSPQPGPESMREVIANYRRSIDGHSSASVISTDQCDGYWFGKAGMDTENPGFAESAGV